jgi:predicted transcriptional regulator of viral defense system
VPQLEPTTENYREGLGKKESFLISSLANENRNIFNVADAKSIVDGAAKKTINNLVRKKWLLPLKRELYAIVPLDIGVKGADSFAVHNFVIGSKLVEPYYIGYWSALNYYGFSDQIPSTTFIATTSAKEKIEVLQTTYLFVQVTQKNFGE